MVCFFLAVMLFPLTGSGRSCIYNTNRVSSLRVCDNKQAPLGRDADGYETLLTL